MASTSTQGQPRDLQLIHRLGPGRMEPYLEATGYHARRALVLYQWNGMVSASFWQLISVAEVVLRNCLDDHIGEWCQNNGGSREWLLHPAAMPQPLNDEFSGRAKSFYSHAIRAQADRDTGAGITLAAPHPRAGQPLENGDVLAQITLGVWGEHFIPRSPKKLPGREMKYFPDETTYNRRLKLWNDVVCTAFPKSTDPGELSHRLSRLKLFRNRIAHHEPILNVDVERHRRELLKLLKEIDPTAREWYLGSDPIPGMLKKDPRQHR